MQAQVFVVSRANKLGCIDHAFFQSGIQVARCELLWYHPQLGQNFSSQATYAEFQAFEICHGFDFFAVPTRHLCAGVAHRHIDHAVVAVELIEQLDAAAHIHPSVLAAGIQAKGQGSAKTKSGVLANVEIAGAVARFHGAVLYAIEHLKRGK